MPISGIAEGVAGHAIWSSLRAVARKVAGRQIQITHPRPLETLSDPEPLGEGVSFPVRGTLKHLAENHQIWLLTEDELTGHVLPQGFSIVQYDSQQETWIGRISAGGKRQVKIIAVVAPPTAQDLFRYLQQVGIDRNYHFEPLIRVPVECTNRAFVPARVPEASDAVRSEVMNSANSQPSDALASPSAPGIYIGKTRKRITDHWITYAQTGGRIEQTETVTFRGTWNNGWRYPETDDGLIAPSSLFGFRFRAEGEVNFYIHLRDSATILINTRQSDLGIPKGQQEFRIPLPASVLSNDWQVVLVSLRAVELISLASEAQNQHKTLLPTTGLRTIQRFSIRGNLCLSHIWCLQSLAEFPPEFLPDARLLL